MSEQQPQQQQTPLVYPVSETTRPSRTESNGSFGAVFIVLAVIVVVSAVACFLGRVCSKRKHNNLKPSKRAHDSRPSKGKDSKHTHNAFQTKDGDIEFGFDKRFSSAKVAANGEPAMGRPNSFREPNMGRVNSFREPGMGRPNPFQEPGMGRANSYHEPNMGRPTSSHEPAMGRANSFREPTMGRPNSFRKGEFRGDQGRFAAEQDHEMDFKSGPGPQHYGM